MQLRTFQKTFIRRALAPSVSTAALSIPRGNGKTTLAGFMVANALNPEHEHYAGDGAEVVLFSGSIEQCRLVYRQALTFLDVGKYRLVDSATRVAITNKRTRTRLKAIGSNPKTSLGLVGVPLVVLDEPGALHTVGGEALWDSIVTAQGKPGSKLRAIAIGTIAPAAPGSWWARLVEGGSHGSTYVQALQGDRKKWDQWPEIRRCNPLTAVDAGFRAKLLEERDEARRDSRLKARFLSYRLNVPSADEAAMVLTVEDWEMALARPVAARAGRPIVGVDLGQGRSWSAAVAMWQTGRVEAIACAPGIPSLEAQEKRDKVPAGTYRALHESGALMVAEGLRVQPPAQLMAAARKAWGTPDMVIADRFRVAELRDVLPSSVPVVERVTRWSSASEDIRAIRKLAKDGPMSVDPGSVALLTASLAVAMVKGDDQGNTRMVKRTANGESRDDVAAALVLAAGSYVRSTERRAA